MEGAAAEALKFFPKVSDTVYILTQWDFFPCMTPTNMIGGPATPRVWPKNVRLSSAFVEKQFPGTVLSSKLETMSSRLTLRANNSLVAS